MVSCICYYRGILPDEAFEKQEVLGLQLHVLCGTSTHAQRIIDWINDGVCDAIDKGFIREVVFGIFTHKGRPQLLSEGYAFRISNSELAVVDKSEALAQVKSSIEELCDTLSRMPTICGERHVMMKVYYNQDTPTDYQMIHFSNALPEDAIKIMAEIPPREVPIVTIQTSNHVFHIRAFLPGELAHTDACQ